MGNWISDQLVITSEQGARGATWARLWWADTVFDFGQPNSVIVTGLLSQCLRARINSSQELLAPENHKIYQWQRCRLISPGHWCHGSCYGTSQHARTTAGLAGSVSSGDTYGQASDQSRDSFKIACTCKARTASVMHGRCSFTETTAMWACNLEFQPRYADIIPTSWSQQIHLRTLEKTNKRGTLCTFYEGFGRCSITSTFICYSVRLEIT